AQGKQIYYQNCIPCHGDHLDGLGELGDGAVVLEARREGIEPRGVMTEAVEVVTVTGNAVLVVDLLALRDEDSVRVGERPQWILEPRQCHRLAAEGDLGRGGRVDRPEIGRRRDGFPHAAE